MWVYVHTFPNGKKYVGITTQKNPIRRWHAGSAYKRQVVYNAILKYGWDNVTHELYETDSKSEMYWLERYLIAFYNTRDRRFGYNMSDGGECGAIGATRGEDFKLKISQARKGKPLSEEHRKRLSESHKKSDATKNALDKAIKANVGRSLSAEHKARISAANKGKAVSEETREKLRERRNSEAAKAQLAELHSHHKGKVVDAIITSTGKKMRCPVGILEHYYNNDYKIIEA